MYDSIKRITITLSFALLGAGLFTVFHLPLPWLLGPMLSILVIAHWYAKWLYWPKQLRNTGLIIVGYVIGRSLTKEALLEISQHIWHMLFFTLFLVIICLLIAFLLAKTTGLHIKTAILGSIPGGMMQALTLAEETKGVNVGIVTLMQTIRLLCIIIGVPLLVIGNTSTLQNEKVEVFHLTWHFIIFMVSVVIAAWVANKYHLPTAYMLGPAIITVILQLIGLTSEPFPIGVSEIAQLLVGINLGLILHRQKMPELKKMIGYSIISGVLIFIVSMLGALIFYQMSNFTLPTALLALAPGGLDQLGLVAHAIGADLAVVSGFQIFRLFFLLLIMPFIIRLIFRFFDKQKV